MSRIILLNDDISNKLYLTPNRNQQIASLLVISSGKINFDSVVDNKDVECNMPASDKASEEPY